MGNKHEVAGDSNVVELNPDPSLEKLEPVENNIHVDREFSRIKQMMKEMRPIDECIEFYQEKKRKMEAQIKYRLDNLENYGLQQGKSVSSVYGKIAVRKTALKIDYENTKPEDLIAWAKEEGYEELIKVSEPKESFSKSAYKDLFKSTGDVAPGVEIETDVITAKASAL